MTPQSVSITALSSANASLSNALKGLAGTERGAEFLNSVMQSVNQKLPSVMAKSGLCGNLNEALVTQGFPDRKVAPKAASVNNADIDTAPDIKPPKGLTM
jgi:hypothetical protein